MEERTGIQHLRGGKDEVWLSCDELWEAAGSNELWEAAGSGSWLRLAFLTFRQDGCDGVAGTCGCWSCNQDLKISVTLNTKVLVVDYSDPQLINKVRAKLSRTLVSKVLNYVRRWW